MRTARKASIMKPSLRRALSLAALAAAAGCAGSDSRAADSDRYQIYARRCQAYCDASVTSGCSVDTTLDQCIERMACSMFTSTAAPTCKSAFAVYHDCLRSQPDVCTAGDGCQAEFNAAWDTCGASI
jgi:Flp pilus assembly protein TadG